ncbi:hypothetical protein, no similarity [Geotrichum candidum]|uniref:Uncharacterized protein n=1 Tax=Geotrichum candidum TaxID=1173061 RepID=A0A0J9X996_GEOCN|nr:hypothetical protein, no similarity [Geotrichum candidum]
MLNYVRKAWSSCNRHDKKKSITNESSLGLQKQLLLIHLPTELLSKIILELLNEWALMRSFKFTYLRGLLDNIETLPELSTYQMIPLVQVNKFFYKLVWTIIMKFSYWNQKPDKYEGYIWTSILYRSRPFIFNEDMLQSRGIEPVNQFHLEGPLNQNQLRLVRHIFLQKNPFLFLSVGLGLERSITIPKLQYLTTLKIDTAFLYFFARSYDNIKRHVWEKEMKEDGGVEKLRSRLSPFIVNYIKQANYDKLCLEMIIVYYNQLICQAIVNVISLLDHPVSYTIVHSSNTSLELKCLIAIFAEHNMTGQIHSLIMNPWYIGYEDCIRLLALLKPEHLVILKIQNISLTKELTTSLIEHNPNLRKVEIEKVDYRHLDFPSNLEMLITGTYPIFSKFNLPLGQKFTNLIELGLDFQSQIDHKYIKTNLLHVPTLQTLRISGQLLQNIDIMICFLESNPTITSLLMYFNGNYEHLEPLYRSMSNIKLLDISYRSLWTFFDITDFNLASTLDVILTNTSSLTMLLIHNKNQTENLSFKEWATKLSIEYEQNTRHLRYIYVYNSGTRHEPLDISDFIPMFFDITKDDMCEMSPYDETIKKLYRIDGAYSGNKMNAERCRLELDVCGIRKKFQTNK